MRRAPCSRWGVVSVLLAILCDCFLAAIVAKNETVFLVCNPNGTLCEHECINGVWLGQTGQCICNPGYKGMYCTISTKALNCVLRNTCRATKRSVAQLQTIYLIAIVSAVATILIIVCGFGCIKVWHRKSDYDFSAGIPAIVISV